MSMIQYFGRPFYKHRSEHLSYRSNERFQCLLEINVNDNDTLKITPNLRDSIQLYLLFTLYRQE